jgi:hypothetical protein
VFRVHDVQRPRAKVNVLPAERERLADAEPRACEERQQSPAGGSFAIQ